MRIAEILYLFEDRSVYIAQQMGPKLAAQAKQDPGARGIINPGDEDGQTASAVVQTLKSMDPDPQGKSLQWLANRYVRGEFSLEDSGAIKESLALFYRVRNRLPVKDINAIKSVAEFYQMMQSFEDQPDPTSKRQQEAEIKADAKRVIDTPNFKVIVPETMESSCYYGAGTKWCTAASKSDNRFDQYSKSGPLWIVMANFGGKWRKFQIHVEQKEFMNELNQAISKQDIAQLSAIPEYTQFLNYLIKRYYGKFLNKD